MAEKTAREAEELERARIAAEQIDREQMEVLQQLQQTLRLQHTAFTELHHALRE